MLSRIFGLNRGRHASCSGHHYHVIMTGWRCCGCRHKASSKGAEPVSTAECRRPDAIVAASRAAHRDLVLEELGFRAALEDEKTLPINKSRLRLRPAMVESKVDSNVKARNSGSRINA